MLTDEDIALVKESVTMRQLAEHHGIKVNRSGFCCCPFHSEKTGSMKIYPGSGGWHCFGACQEGGDIISFEMRYSGLEFVAAVRHIATAFGVPISDDSQSPEERAEMRRKADQKRREREKREAKERERKQRLLTVCEQIKFLEWLAERMPAFSEMQRAVFDMKLSLEQEFELLNK